MRKTFTLFLCTVLLLFAFPVISVFALEIDQTARYTRVVNGDSFVTTFGEIRLADSDSIVEIPRIRLGRTETIETLISEGVHLFANFLRTEKKSWIPMLMILQN